MPTTSLRSPVYDSQRLFLGLLLLLFEFTAASLSAQGVLTVTGISPAPGGVLTITAQNTASFPPTGFSTSFILQATNNLESPQWKIVPAVFSTPAGPAGFQTTSTTVTLPAGQPKYFYRVIGILGTADDPDGDGLPSATEIGTTNTNPNLYDSDFDGLSDGQKYIYSLPTNGVSSPPVFVANVPTANFRLDQSTATEGAVALQVEVSFDRIYIGTLNYAVSTIGNTAAGTDYTLGGGAPTATTGSVSVAGTSAFIPITVIDDTVTSGQRVLVINLTLNGESYFIGGRASHIILIKDNDAWWTGSLLPDSGETDQRTFRLKITHQGAAVAASFGAGAGLDGLPVPAVPAGGGAPAIAATSVSTALIPAGTWPATDVLDDTTRFQAYSPSLPIGASATGILRQPLRRSLHLDARPALSTPTRPQVLTPDVRYVGTYEEELTTEAGTELCTLSGTFVLQRDLPAPPPATTTLLP